MAIRITKMHFTDHQKTSKVLVTFHETDPENISSAVITETSWQEIERLLTKSDAKAKPMNVVDES